MPLSRREIIELSAAIEDRRNELIEDNGRVETYAVVAVVAVGLGDEAIADLIADLYQADTERDLAELRELDEARDRLAAGTYGVCSRCGADVDLSRLRAQPSTARCPDCQEKLEHTHAMRASMSL